MQASFQDYRLAPGKTGGGRWGAPDPPTPERTPYSESVPNQLVKDLPETSS